MRLLHGLMMLFAATALAAAEFLIGKTGVFGMEDLFGE